MPSPPVGSPYDQLGVPADADLATIRAAYRRAARATHPDHGGTAAAFQAVDAAYRLLADPAARAVYDRHRIRPDDAASEHVPVDTVWATALDRWLPRTLAYLTYVTFHGLGHGPVVTVLALAALAVLIPAALAVYLPTVAFETVLAVRHGRPRPRPLVTARRGLRALRLRHLFVGLVVTAGLYVFLMTAGWTLAALIWTVRTLVRTVADLVAFFNG